jgi:hypothetical protein
VFAFFVVVVTICLVILIETANWQLYILWATDTALKGPLYWAAALGAVKVDRGDSRQGGQAGRAGMVKPACSGLRQFQDLSS